MMGKVLGFAIGFWAGGWLGGLVGLYFGFFFDRRAAGKGPLNLRARLNPQAQAEAQQLFFDVTFEVMGHIAKADGQVSQAEIHIANLLMDRMQLHGEKRQRAQQAFSTGKVADYPLEQRVIEFRRSSHGQSRKLFLEIQLQSAFADGEVHDAERQVLYRVAKSLHIPQLIVDQLLKMVEASMHFQQQQAGGVAPGSNEPTIEDAYALLGVESSVNDRELKLAYRKLMSEHHPDKLASQGVAEEAIKLATERTQQIQQAYALIKKNRG